MERKKRCANCGQLTHKWQRVNGGSWHCYDGCYSATGRDRRTEDGHPLWLKKDGKDEGRDRG